MNLIGYTVCCLAYISIDKGLSHLRVQILTLINFHQHPIYLLLNSYQLLSPMKTKFLHIINQLTLHLNHTLDIILILKFYRFFMDTLILHFIPQESSLIICWDLLASEQSHQLECKFWLCLNIQFLNKCLIPFYNRSCRFQIRIILLSLNWYGHEITCLYRYQFK